MHKKIDTVSEMVYIVTKNGRNALGLRLVSKLFSNGIKQYYEVVFKSRKRDIFMSISV